MITIKLKINIILLSLLLLSPSLAFSEWGAGSHRYGDANYSSYGYDYPEESYRYGERRTHRKSYEDYAKKPQAKKRYRKKYTKRSSRKSLKPGKSGKRKTAAKNRYRKKNTGKNKRYKYYRIKRGDTLYSISRKFRVSVNSIYAINRLPKNAKLKFGKRIKIAVKPGYKKPAGRKRTTKKRKTARKKNAPHFNWPLRKVVSCRM